MAGGWEVEGILEGNILRRGGGKCRERKDRKDAANATPAILKQKLRHFLLPRGSPVPASRGAKKASAREVSAAFEQISDRKEPCQGVLKEKKTVLV